MTSMTTVTVSSGNMNLKSPLQMCWETVTLLAISEIQISDSSKHGGGSKYSILSSAYRDVCTDSKKSLEGLPWVSLSLLRNEGGLLS